MKHRRSTAGSKGPLRHDGFTLLELLVVLVISGLLLAIAAPGLANALASARLRVTGRQIAAALHETQADAMRQAAPERLVIDNSGRGFITDGKHFSLPAGQSLSYAPILKTSPGRTKAAWVKFLADGSSSGGALIVDNGRRQTRIEVDWLTGRISVR